MDHSVLILGEQSASAIDLAARARQVGFRTVRAKTPHDAIAMAEERGLAYRIVLLQPDLPVVDLGQALDEIRLRARCPELTAIAAGHAPLGEERERLHRAGVRLALWEPVHDHALRFQLNRALAGARGVRGARGAQRVSTDWVARVYSAGRAKAVDVYSVSSGGTFLATRRPSQKGALLAVDLELPNETLSLAGQVVYTNVPGNLQRSSLPTGMAVRFTDPPEAATAALERGVSRCAESLHI